MSLSACAVVLPLRVLLTVLLLQGSPCGFLKGALSMTVLLPAQSRLELFNDTEALQPVHVEIPDTSTSIFTESKEETLSQRNTSSATSHALHSGMTRHICNSLKVLMSYLFMVPVCLSRYKMKILHPKCLGNTANNSVMSYIVNSLDSLA